MYLRVNYDYYRIEEYISTIIDIGGRDSSLLR